MADFVQTMKDWRRMCKAQDDTTCGACESCPMMDNGASCMAVYEDEFDNVDYAHIEQTVTAWAAEHPVVYPTWGEWFVEHGDLVDGWQNATNAAWMANTALSIFMKPVPADIAEKLGLQPKEG